MRPASDQSPEPVVHPRFIRLSAFNYELVEKNEHSSNTRIKVFDFCADNVN